MAKKLYTESYIEDIADAIREKTGGSDTYTVSEMAQAIEDIDDIADNKWIMRMLNNKPATIYAEFIIPDSVTQIGDYDSTYNQAARLLTMIPARKFSGANVTTIKTNAWYYSKYVEELDFPECVTVSSNIAEYATNLETINFPKLKTMSNGFAFARCTSLTEAYLPELETAGRGLLTDDTALVHVYLPKLKSISGSGALNQVLVTDLCMEALEQINEGLLSESSITNLSFPALNSAINKSCLNSCASLTNLFLPGDTQVGLTTTNIFTNSPIKALTGTIWVNDDLVNAYKSATNWSAYASIIRPVSEYTGSFDYLHAVWTGGATS